ncbi:fibrous sheath CABYR-binding protein-like isoform X2 [Triplophysa rosa]|uniref:fibrous sheath CABYR-binding protein-like isoform X2 n=1 Tax=Triplophysa rosa TaxID=992332 RepID=UPI002545C6B0|nr:fibrous sheath CABYR-binding protein-like isoform X2 [Triplophysa rosa]
MAAGGDEAVQPYMFEPKSDTEEEASEQAVQVRIGQDVSTWQESSTQRQMDKSESRAPPAAAAAPITAPSQGKEVGGQQMATKPSIAPDSPPQVQRPAWGVSLPPGQCSFWETFPPQQKSCLQGQRDKSESQAPPAAAAVPRAASPQSQESVGQEKSTKASPPQQESSTKKQDKPDPAKMESRAPPATAAVTKPSSPERQESVGQETATKPAVAPAAPPQQESSTQRQRDESESQAPPAVAAAPSFPTTRASTEAPVTAASPPQLESSTETLDMKVQTKSESQEPPAAAAVPETAPGDVVDTSKISNKAKRRMRKMRNILKRQETAEQETQMQEVSETLETDTSIEHLCELLDGLHLSSEPSAPATQSPVLELHHIGANSSGTFNRLKPLCPATFIFKFSPTFDFGPTQETDSQMSGQEVSTETPETEEPRETPSPSEGQGAALEPVDHVGDVSSASPRASKAVKKTKRRMTKTKKNLQQRQEVTDPRETDNVEHLCELLDGYIFLQSPLPQPHHLPFLSFIE